MSTFHHSDATAWLIALQRKLVSYVDARHSDWQRRTAALRPLQALAAELELDTDEGLARALADGGKRMLSDPRVRSGLEAFARAPNGDCEHEIVFVAGAAARFEDCSAPLSAEGGLIVGDLVPNVAGGLTWAQIYPMLARQYHAGLATAAAFWAGWVAADDRHSARDRATRELLTNAELGRAKRLGFEIELRITAG